MSGDWYHQHFGVSKGPLRMTAWFRPNNARRAEYEATLRAEGAVSRMENWIYETPREGEKRPMREFPGL